MKAIYFLFSLLGVLNFAVVARAAGNSNFRTSAEAGYLTDTQGLTSTKTTKVSYDFAASYTPSKDGNLSFNIGHLYINSIEPVSANASALLKSFNPYLGLRLSAGDNQLISLSFNYMPYTQASYTQSGLPVETWTGTGYSVKLSLHPKLSDRFDGMISVLYYSAQFTKKTADDGAVTSVSSFSRSYLTPLVGLQIRF